MSVLIKGMEMPRNCCECAIRSYDANGQEEYCPITEIECLSIGRQDACPLTEVIDVNCGAAMKGGENGCDDYIRVVKHGSQDDFRLVNPEEQESER